MSEIQAGELIGGRYRVLARIGSGGMADVYLAEDELLSRNVAVKVLQRRFIEDEDLIERFRREASAAASLSHPNVVAIFDRGTWNGTYYIAMEYLPGRTLKQLIREHGSLDALDAIDIAIEVLKAAGFAHRNRIIHRDLKPHNVILGDEGRVSVTDFGIARAGASEMTHTGSIMGTAQYLSPEQARGGEVDPTSDIYAIGILLFELLTGRVPFEGDSAVAIALQHLSAEPMAPSSINPAVPAELDAVILRALAKEPAGRYASAEAMIEALQGVRARIAAGRPAASTAGAEAMAHDPLAERAAAAYTATALAELPPSPEQIGAQNAGAYAASGHPGGSVGGALPEPSPGARRRRRNSYLAAAGALLLAGGALAAALLFQSPAAEVTVPAVEGLLAGVAEGQLRAAGLVPSLRTAASGARPGTVIAQSPKAASLARKGDHVLLTVSIGASSEVVPNVARQPSTRAVQILRERGFLPRVVSRSSASVAAGTVIATNPPAEVDAVRGANIEVYVSSGAAGPAQGKGHVPNVIGMDRHSAETALSAAGFSTGSVGGRQDATATPGSVIAQTPEGGAPLAEGQPVSLVLAEAPSTITVPNVIGDNETAAAALLGESGLTPESRSENVTSSAEVGIVLEESPAAGQKVKRRSKVTIVVGSQSASTMTSTSVTSSLSSSGGGR